MIRWIFVLEYLWVETGRKPVLRERSDQFLVNSRVF